jgi:predicted HAD superfamily Cof-like phosphohydrolase
MAGTLRDLRTVGLMTFGRNQMRKFDPKEMGLEVVPDYTPPPARLHRLPRRKEISFPNPPSVEEMVAVFHCIAEVPVGETTFKNSQRTRLRWDLIKEEFDELTAAWIQEDSIDSLDAICDLVYVLVGAAVEFGWQFDEAFRRVHHSNMTKLTGRIRERRDGKILKGKDYEPPRLEDLI